MHLAAAGGRAVWIERASAPITQDDRLTPALACAQTGVVCDDTILEAALVACGASFSRSGS